METGHPSTRAVNSGSGNWALHLYNVKLNEYIHAVFAVVEEDGEKSNTVSIITVSIITVSVISFYYK